MSLYSGISFGSSVASSGSGGKDDAISVDAAPGNAGDAAGKTAAQADADKYAAEQAANAAREQQESNRKAALGFQPVVRKRPAAGSAALKPRMATATLAAAAAGPSLSTAAPATSTSASPLAAAAAPAKQSAEPAPASTSAPATATGGTSMVGRTLIVAPSMTLADEDVNGFASSAAGKKAHAQANKRAGGNSKKNKAKRRGGAGAEEDPSLAWTAEYDPARPTDYTMYKEYTKLLRAQKREAAREERRLKEREQRLREAYGESGTGSGSSGSDDDDGDDSDEERRRRIDAAEKRFKGFVPPPVSYDTPVQPYPYRNDDDAVPDDTDEEDAPSGMQGVQPAAAASAPTSKNEADEWASWSGAAPASGAAVVDDPYARRMAMSIQNQSGQPAQPSQPIQAQLYAPAAQPPAFPHPSAFGVPPLNLPLPGGQSIPLPPSFQARPASASPLPGTSPAGAAQMPQPPQTSAAGGVSIEEAQARARAIAARLAAMKGGVSPAGSAGASSPYVAPPASSYDGIPGIDPPQPPAPQASVGGRPSPGAGIASQGNPEDFAKNLMNKYGWTKGQGLGATSQGMLNPLALSTDPATAVAGASKKKKQQQQAQQQQQQAQAKVTGMASAKGRVTSDLKTEKERAEREKFGEPTRIVCLSNMVGRDEVDEELVNDVSEEAGKLGILERCFVHVMPEYAPEDDAVRVFIVYSGLVGAWKAAKAFEGRLFGGRQVRARFYDETAFATRTLHL